MKTTVAHSAAMSTRLTPSGNHQETGTGYLIHFTQHLDQCHSDSFHKYYLMNEMSELLTVCPSFLLPDPDL